MYDFHYDLLTKIYIDYLNHDLNAITLFCTQNYGKHNVSGLVANLSFMSDQEMKDEYHVCYSKKHNLIQMFEITTNIAKKIIPNIEILFSIEGCDKLNNIQDLKQLYNLGLRAIAPVWNEKNQFGSGIRTELGLTTLGKQLIIEAIDLGIAIDLSHTNLKTFDDIINIVNEEIKVGKDPIVYASHSNCFNFCPRKRNLTDDQIKKLKSINAYIGIFSNTNFISLEKLDQLQYEGLYIKHIKHIKKIYGNVDHIVLSTDDMKWCENTNSSYGKSHLFSYNSLQKNIKNILSKEFSLDEVEKIMYKNGQKIFETINKKSK